VTVVNSWDGRTAPPDAMLALHARRSAESIVRYRQQRRRGGLLLALTGTDVYRDIHDDDTARQSLTLADRIVVLQPRALDELNTAARNKAAVVYQSAAPLKPAARPLRRFDIVQVGHLRHEKDPFTPITALRHLPDDSRIRLTQIGEALDAHHADAMAVVCRDEPRLRWAGSLSHAATRQRIKRAHLLVIASRMEGGANVIVEAVMAGVPVLASDVSGNIGMLGEHYPGLFRFGDAAACAALMQRAESSSRFYERLGSACAQRARHFAPEREAAAIRAAVARVCA